MTDEEIIAAVRSGTHTLVPMPVGDRKFFIGYTHEADLPRDHYGLILDLNPDEFEGEEIGGLMMGGLTSAAPAAWRECAGDVSDDKAPF